MRNGAQRPQAASRCAKPALGLLGQLGAWSGALAGQTQRHPARTVALTVGTGFILGGGLFSPLTARILGAGVQLGLRSLVLPMLVEGLGSLTRAAFDRNLQTET